jgi:hypothetical protein
LENRLPKGLATELSKARTEINKLTGLGEIIAKCSDWVERVGEQTGVPLLNIPAVIRKLS